jgi:hypothetical protein
MQTMEQLAQQYTVNKSGIIQNRGKFEGEHYLALFFWNLMLDGVGEELYAHETVYSLFLVDEEMVKEHPELEGTHGVKIYEDSQGFVSCRFYTEKKEFDVEQDRLLEIANAVDDEDYPW